MKYSKEVKKEMAKAEKEARKQILKPQKKKRTKRTASTPQEPRSPSGRWIDDEWGNQGCVFFDGKLYWLTMFKYVGNESYEAVPTALSEEQWEEYKKKPVRSGLPNRGQKLETTETEKPLSSTRQTTKSTKVSKTVPKKKSPTKSGKTVTPLKQRKWQLTSTSHEVKKSP